MSDLSLRFVTRKDCHLCDEARPLVKKIASRFGLEIEEVDVDSFDDLSATYGDRVPVVLDPAGVVVAEGRIDRKSLRRAARRLFQ